MNRLVFDIDRFAENKFSILFQTFATPGMMLLMLPIDLFIEEAALLKAGIYEIPEAALPEIETGNKSYDKYGIPLFSSIDLGKSEIDVKTFEQAQGYLFFR